MMSNQRCKDTIPEYYQGKENVPITSTPRTKPVVDDPFYQKQTILKHLGWCVRHITRTNGTSYWLYTSPQGRKTYKCLEEVTIAFEDVGITWDTLARDNSRLTPFENADLSDWINEFKRDRLALNQVRQTLSNQATITHRDVQIMHTVYYVSQRLQFCMDQFHQWMHGNEILLCRYPLPGKYIPATSIVQQCPIAVVTAEYPRNMDDYTDGHFDNATGFHAIAIPEHDNWNSDEHITPIVYPADIDIYDNDWFPSPTFGHQFSLSMFALTAMGGTTEGPYYPPDFSMPCIQQERRCDDTNSIIPSDLSMDSSFMSTDALTYEII